MATIDEVFDEADETIGKACDVTEKAVRLMRKEPNAAKRKELNMRLNSLAAKVATLKDAMDAYTPPE